MENNSKMIYEDEIKTPSHSQSALRDQEVDETDQPQLDFMGEGQSLKN